MKKHIIFLALVITAFSSCDKNDLSMTRGNVLGITVKNCIGTKGIIEETTLPSGSEIGLFVTDQTGVTYDGNTIANVKFTATGEGDAQKWNAVSDVLLSATVASVGSYYPYDESVYDITAIPIEATSEVQKDWMWGIPVSGLDKENKTASITMNHALAVVRFNIIKGNFAGVGNVDYVSVKSNAGATSAVMNATTGALTGIKGAGYIFESTDEFTLSEGGTKVDFIVVPTGTEAPLDICVLVNGTEMAATTADVTLEAGKIYEYEVSVGVEALQLSKINITEWGEGEIIEQMFSPQVPVVNIEGNITNNYTNNTIHIEQSYNNKVLTIKASTYDVGYSVKQVTVTGAKSSQSVDDKGVRTIVITDIVSDVTVKFYGLSFEPWARIQHKDGTLYTAEEWRAAETAGTVTDADANGVAVRSSYYAACPHVIHPEISEEHKSWCSNPSDKNTSPCVNVLGCVTVTTGDDAKLDVNGKANTDAILKYCSSGFFETAPAAQYCAGVTFANGQQGYMPSAGEMYAWINNETIINSCLNAISGTNINSSSMYDILSSTQYDYENIWTIYVDGYKRLSLETKHKTNGSTKKARAVTSFSY